MRFCLTHMHTSTHILITTPVLDPRCPVTEPGKPFQRQALCHAGPSFDSKFVMPQLLTTTPNCEKSGNSFVWEAWILSSPANHKERPTKRWSTGSTERESTKPKDAWPSLRHHQHEFLPLHSFVHKARFFWTPNSSLATKPNKFRRRDCIFIF